MGLHSGTAPATQFNHNLHCSLCGVCMHSLGMCVFSPGTPASSIFQDVPIDKLIGHGKLLLICGCLYRILG